jgi:multidrug resistance efflux pump
MNKLNSFVKQFAAILKGDDAEAKAAKVWRQAESAFKVQIASLNGDLIRKEDTVTVAEENLEKALVNNGNEIGDNRDGYIANLIAKKEALRQAVKQLAAHEDTIEFLEEQYALLKAE